MPDTIIQITELASLGLVEDTPSVVIAQNAFSDCMNVRLRDGTVSKMEGETEITGLTPDDFPTDTIEYVAYWQSPFGNYYVTVETGGIIKVYDVDDTSIVSTFDSGMNGANPKWQHTLFNGGFHFIINNGVDVPSYLNSPIDAATILPLPNWDSYLSQEEVSITEWGGDDFTGNITLSRASIAADERIIVTITPRDFSLPIRNGNLAVGASTGTILDIGTVNLNADTGFLELDPTDVATGDIVKVVIQNTSIISVTAGVVRAFGSVLVAGDLYEQDAMSNTIRRLPGVIRTSDVAAPGEIPLNWNPFHIGANTADEFVLSSTGQVQDMVELQGLLYVYTDTSIHSIQSTDNDTIPFSIQTVTDSYGANNLGSVIEVDGKHIVYGSNDVYVFSGHPSNIESISDGRVRDSILASYQANDVRILRNQRYDEIWFYTIDSTNPEMFLWNYRSNVWTKRSQSGVVAGDVVNFSGILRPFFTNGETVFVTDETYTDFSTGNYTSFIERDRMSLAPEFNTESVQSIALLAEGVGILDVSLRGTNIPGDLDGVLGGEDFTFNLMTQYKVDTRIQGRFANLRIGDTSDTLWRLSGIQLDIIKGGTR